MTLIISTSYLRLLKYITKDGIRFNLNCFIRGAERAAQEGCTEYEQRYENELLAQFIYDYLADLKLNVTFIKSDGLVTIFW